MTSNRPDEEKIVDVLVAGPGFPRRGANPKGVHANLLFCIIFVENDMKM